MLGPSTMAKDKVPRSLIRFPEQAFQVVEPLDHFLSEGRDKCSLGQNQDALFGLDI